MSKRYAYFYGFLLVILFFVACAPTQSTQLHSSPVSRIKTHNVRNTGSPPSLSLTISGHRAAATVPPNAIVQPTALPASGSAPLPTTILGGSPYGTPPGATGEEIQLTQQLFALINSDRAARGLYAYQWNATLAGGARLHSWNMYHCGFSHTCPDGRSQCQRIADEGFAGYTDCGENIGYAGPYPTAAKGVYTIQESMANEPPTGWHRIHLFSTTLHRVGVGVYVDAGGIIWFTEDLVN